MGQIEGNKRKKEEIGEKPWGKGVKIKGKERGKIRIKGVKKEEQKGKTGEERRKEKANNINNKGLKKGGLKGIRDRRKERRIEEKEVKVEEMGMKGRKYRGKRSQEREQKRGQKEGQKKGKERYIYRMNVRKKGEIKRRERAQQIANKKE